MGKVEVGLVRAGKMNVKVGPALLEMAVSRMPKTMKKR